MASSSMESVLSALETLSIMVRLVDAPLERSLKATGASVSARMMNSLTVMATAIPARPTRLSRMANVSVNLASDSVLAESVSLAAPRESSLSRELAPPVLLTLST